MINAMTTIGDIADIYDGPHATPKKINVGPYFLSISSLEKGRLDLSKSAHVSEEQFTKWTKRVTPKENDLLFSYETRLGEAALMPDGVKACLGRRMGLLRPKPNKVNPDYLLYAYLSPFFQNVIKSNTIVGATVNRIALSEMAAFPIRIPSTEEQYFVSTLLKTIDKKIELNNRINAELEAMAKTLYDYWFVQFDFPDTDGRPYKSSGGKMVYNDSFGRKVPAEWNVNFLSDWIKADKTGDWGKEVQEGNYTLQVDCIRGADINGINGPGKVAAPNRFILKKNEHKLLSPFDFVIEISGGSPTQSTGRLSGITQEVLERFEYPVICSNFCKAISLKNISYFYNFGYMWQWIYDHKVLFGWEGKTSGIKNLLFDSFVTKYSVAMPPEDLAKKFYDFVSPLQSKKQTLLKESSELEALRDWLLPMLMNGQVTVK
ncbi:restriction endonuclease subunit S [Vibrio gigantis]|uniref:restriction endonuclease subunit S n=1 Tax=Vibrio gigantis TaxID=296199 RepID=UPI001BFDE847|nr:restriction endonuclease subunit S [Vibrio gigantis]